MFLTYRRRILPSKRQHLALAAICEAQRQLYNAALQERIDCYRKTGKSLSYMSQTISLTKIREDDVTLQPVCWNSVLRGADCRRFLPTARFVPLLKDTDLS
jgi:putative transposase